MSWADTLKPQGKVTAQQPPVLPEFQRQLDELRKENKELKEQLRRLMSQMAGKHLKETEDYASATSGPNQPRRGSRSRSRSRSRDRKSRSPTRKSTVSSQETSLLREDSRYTQVLDILRQDRTNDRQRLERLVSDKIQEATTLLQTRMNDKFAEIMYYLQQTTDEFKRRKSTDPQ